MSARADIRLAIVIVATLVVAPMTAWAAAASNGAPSAARAQEILEQNRPLAKNGDASAQYNMGVLYDQGYGVKRDYAKARQWYEKAAAQHYPRAEHNLGIMYEAGKGVPKDRGKAAQWFRRGADDGQAASQNNLAVLYMKGNGVPQNTGKAAFWAARAAAGGNSAAIDNLPRIITDLPHVHVNADDVNVRDQPNREARVVGHADSEAVAVVLSRGDDWTQILLPDDYTLGWVANFLLSDSQAPLAGESTPKAEPSETAESGRPDTPSPDQMATTAPHPSEPAENKTSAAPKPPKHASGEDLTGDRHKQPSSVAASKVIVSKTSPPESAPSSSAGPEQEERPTDQASSEAAKPGDERSSQSSSSRSTTAAATASKPADQAPEQTEAKTSEPAPDAKPAQAGASSATHAAVGVNAINVRAKAGSGGRVIGQLHRGDRVTLLDQHNGWRYIQTASGMKGWVAGYLLVVQ